MHLPGRASDRDPGDSERVPSVPNEAHCITLCITLPSWHPTFHGSLFTGMNLILTLHEEPPMSTVHKIQVDFNNWMRKKKKKNNNSNNYWQSAIPRGDQWLTTVNYASFGHFKRPALFQQLGSLLSLEKSGGSLERDEIWSKEPLDSLDSKEWCLNHQIHFDSL